MSPQFKPKFGKLLAVAGTLIGLGGCATSLPTSSAMQIGEVAVAPSGFMSFCQREPQECGLGGVQSNAELDAALAGANRAQWSALFAQAPGGFRGGFSNVTSTAPGLPLKDGYGWAELFAANNAAAATPAQTPPVEEIALADDASLQVSAGEPAATRPTLQIAEVSVAAPLATRAAFAVEPPPRLDEALMHVLDTVNQSVNSRIKPGEDAEVFGQADYWALPLSRGLGTRGNCKHYALEKRKALAERGVPTSALSLAIVRTREGATHAVLLVATDRGEFVLDNLSPWVAPWRQTGYVWLERQTPGDPLQWRTLASLTTGPFA